MGCLDVCMCVCVCLNASMYEEGLERKGVLKAEKDKEERNHVKHQ